MKSALAGLKLHLFVLHVENCVDIWVDADVVELKIFHRWNTVETFVSSGRGRMRAVENFFNWV